MPAIAGWLLNCIIDRRYFGNRLFLRAVTLSLTLLNIDVVGTALASGAKQTAEAMPFYIHPLCLRSLIGAMDSSRPDVVEVKASALTKCKDAVIEVEIRERGIFAYNSSETRTEGYTEYTFMGDLLESHGSVFHYEYSGGGTGRFTSLWLLEGELTGGENMVRISFLEGTGDRCGGYISNAQVIEGPSGDDLVVERLITPFIFLVKGDDGSGAGRDRPAGASTRPMFASVGNGCICIGRSTSSATRSTSSCHRPGTPRRPCGFSARR